MPSKMPHRRLRQRHKHGMAKLHGTPPRRRKAADAFSLLYAPYINIYIHRAHTLLEYPLAHLGCLWLLDKGWHGSQFAPVKPPGLASTLQRGQEQQWASTACKARVDGQSECSTSGKLSFTLMGLGWPPHCYVICPCARRKPHRSDTAFSP